MKELRGGCLRTEILSYSIQSIGRFKTIKRLMNIKADRKRVGMKIFLVMYRINSINSEKRLAKIIEIPGRWDVGINVAHNIITQKKKLE